ncbi:hypothetical protein J2Y67_005295 [Neobacillus niacini]|nr:hypothetical protein [Neobacillus niacini]MDR7002767.1 hypothetical protein [Neobacillus niacini]
MSRRHQTIAKRLVEVQQTAASLVLDVHADFKQPAGGNSRHA